MKHVFPMLPRPSKPGSKLRRLRVLLERKTAEDVFEGDVLRVERVSLLRSLDDDAALLILLKKPSFELKSGRVTVGS